MTAPTPERPTLADDLDQAYARAHALADADRGPAVSVRANVLAAAREIAAQAEAKPALTPVAAPVSDVGRGRAGAWNLSSWRVRSGGALFAVLLVALGVMRFDARRHDVDKMMVAEASVSVAMLPPSPVYVPEPPKMRPPPPVMAERMAAMPAAPAQAVMPMAPVPRAADAVDAKAASRDPERVVAQADQPTLTLAAPPPPAVTFARAPAAAPATAPSDVDDPRKVVVAGNRLDLSSANGGTLLRGSAESARKVSPGALGSAVGASLRPQPSPLQAAANADDVDALGKLLADPSNRVDAVDANGRTALMTAVMAANVRAVRLLLDAGADPEHADSTGATPRSVARAGPNAEIAALLGVRR